MRDWFSFLRLARVVCGVLGLAAACAGDAQVGKRVEGPSRAFRDIPIVSAAGRSVPFSVALAERPALVSFWAPWCEPCVRELPDLERLARRVAPCGASVVGIAVGESPAAIMAFARARQLAVPQFTDQEFILADAIGQTRIPATVVFDGAQRIVFVGQGLDARAVRALWATFDKNPAVADCSR